MCASGRRITPGQLCFHRRKRKQTLLEARRRSDLASAHFYLAACSRSPIAVNETFAWVPSSANVLREREQHIAKLGGELKQKDAWLRQSVEAHAELLRAHEAVTAELIRSNNWAEELTRELTERKARICRSPEIELDIRLTWVTVTWSRKSKARGQSSNEPARIKLPPKERSRDWRRWSSSCTAWAEGLNSEKLRIIAGNCSGLDRQSGFARARNWESVHACVTVNEGIGSPVSANAAAADRSPVCNCDLRLRAGADRCAPGNVRQTPGGAEHEADYACGKSPGSFPTGTGSICWRNFFLPGWLPSPVIPAAKSLLWTTAPLTAARDWVRANYPEVRVLALPQNLGFGGGSNAGFREARNDVVVLLNSDMRVEPDFLAPHYWRDFRTKTSSRFP